MKGVISGLFTIILTGFLFGGEIDPDLQMRLRELQHNDINQVIVELNHQADLLQVRGNRAEVISLLQNVVNTSQSKIISF